MTTSPDSSPASSLSDAPATPTRERVYTRAFILLFFMEFTIFVTFYMLLPTVPLYIKELGGTQSTVGWVIGIAGPVAAFGVPLYGLGVDRWSRRGMAVLGLAINVIGAIIMIFVLSPLMLLIPTILRRVGSGATGSATRTMILDIAPPNRRGEAMTNFATSHNIAIAFGPAVGLWIYHGFGSTPLFIVCAAVMAGASLFLLPVGRTEHRAGGRRGPVDAQTEAIAEPRKETWVDKLVVREALVPGLSVLLLSAAYLATTTFVSILGEEREIPNYGSFFVVYAVVVIAGRLLTGRISDTHGRAVILLPSLAADGWLHDCSRVHLLDRRVPGGGVHAGAGVRDGSADDPGNCGGLVATGEVRAGDVHDDGRVLVRLSGGDGVCGGDERAAGL